MMRPWYVFTKHISVMIIPHAIMIVGTEGHGMRDFLVRREGHKLHRDGLNNLMRMFLHIVLA